MHSGCMALVVNRATMVGVRLLNCDHLKHMLADSQVSVSFPLRYGMISDYYGIGGSERAAQYSRCALPSSERRSRACIKLKQDSTDSRSRRRHDVNHFCRERNSLTTRTARTRNIVSLCTERSAWCEPKASLEYTVAYFRWCVPQLNFLVRRRAEGICR